MKHLSLSLKSNFYPLISIFSNLYSHTLNLFISSLLFTVVKLQGDFTFIQSARIKDFITDLHLTSAPIPNTAETRCVSTDYISYGWNVKFNCSFTFLFIWMSFFFIDVCFFSAFAYIYFLLFFSLFLFTYLTLSNLSHFHPIFLF